MVLWVNSYVYEVMASKPKKLEDLPLDYFDLAYIPRGRFWSKKRPKGPNED